METFTYTFENTGNTYSITVEYEPGETEHEDGHWRTVAMDSWSFASAIDLKSAAPITQEQLVEREGIDQDELNDLLSEQGQKELARQARESPRDFWPMEPGEVSDQQEMQEYEGIDDDCIPF